MVELLALLLPIAAATGWYAAQKKYRSAHLRARTTAFHQSFTRGVELLLLDRMSEALEALAPVIQSNREGLDLQLAVGHLYRRKGFVETALAIHQSLAEREDLSPQQRDFVAFQLGLDYLAAGLLDRAEAAFRGLLESTKYRVESLRQLLKIYQNERDWVQAIDCARELRMTQSRNGSGSVAQFFCELARNAGLKGDVAEAERLLRLALEDDARCVRATIALGNLCMDAGDWGGAAEVFANVEQQDPAFVSEVLPQWASCFDRMGKPSGLHSELRRIFLAYGNEEVACFLVDRIRRMEGEGAAREFLRESLGLRRSAKLGYKLLRSLGARFAAEEDRADLQLILASRPDPLAEPRGYRCSRCGFQGQELHWNCPSCQNWETIKPVS